MSNKSSTLVHESVSSTVANQGLGKLTKNLYQHDQLEKLFNLQAEVDSLLQKLQSLPLEESIN